MRKPDRTFHVVMRETYPPSAPRGRRMPRAKAPGKIAVYAHLIARKDGVLCTVCGELEPVHGGESGTPLPSLLAGYFGSMRRHPPEKHERVFGR